MTSNDNAFVAYARVVPATERYPEEKLSVVIYGYRKQCGKLFLSRSQLKRLSEKLAELSNSA